MSVCELPTGWFNVELGEVLELKYGKSLPAKNRDGNGSPVYGSNGIVGMHSEPIVNTKGLIIGRKGSFGEVHISQESYSPIDTTYFVDEFFGMPIKYWYYQLKRLPLTQLNRSTAIPGLNRDDAYEQQINLPSLEEQKQIATKLDELLAQVDTIKTRIDAIPTILKRFRQSVLAAAVSGKLTEEWRDKFSSRDNNIDDVPNIQSSAYIDLKEILDDSTFEIPEIPKIWTWKHLTDITESDSPIMYGILQPGPPQGPSGVPYIRPTEIVDDKINLPQIRTTTKAIAEKYKRAAIRGGDSILSIVGTIGKVAEVPVELDGGNITQSSVRIRQDEGIMFGTLLRYYLRSPLLFKEYRSLSLGTAVPRLNVRDVRRLVVPVPKIEEQREIIRYIDQLFAISNLIEQRVTDAQSQVNNLTKSILAKAFRGELTAEWREQNPDLISGENSAEVLLEKIKTMRAVAAKQKKPVRQKIKKKSDSTMKPKNIIPVVEALKSAQKPLTSQQLLAESGYPGDASVEQLETFFLDIREQVDLGVVARERRGDEELLSLVD